MTLSARFGTAGIRSRYGAGFVLGAAIVIRCVLSAHMIDRPGLNADETMFVNAATLRIPGWWIGHQVLGIPLNIWAYVGALKSWLYAPIFSLFGTSAATVRIPMVLVASGSLLLLYSAVRDLVNRPVALLAVVLLAFDQSVFWYTRNDVGPSALEFALKCAALYCLARFCADRRERWVVLALVALGAGVFNKLNFIWFVNAASAISLFVAIRHRATINAWRRIAVVWFAGLALITVAFGAYYVHYHIGDIMLYGRHVGSFSLRWSQFTRGNSYILSGSFFYYYALASMGPRPLVAAVMVALFCAGAVASIVRWSGRSQAVAGMTAGTVLIALQCLFTYQAQDGWHYLAIYPLFMVVAAYGVYAIALALLRGPGRVLAAAAIVGTAALVYDGLLFADYTRALSEEPGFSTWSPAVYPLTRYLEHQPGTVFTTDWGIANPLLTLSPSTRYRDVANDWYATQSPATLIRTEVAQSTGPKLFVTRVTGKLLFKQVRARLLSGGGARLSLIKTIDGLQGVPVFEIYRWR
ncbi:MAG: glycosyltransferase family 39 protein [Solirubrobacterales bacterium]|nr:glycosyltransferase family 39 protein [Solirubrobacterales bacterium]